ncbi:MAG: M1 family metallopeptidase [Bacteroidia bacterium]|jgi:aminopeptidase N|nr:M1 family metallopeptidase [Bacteroidia bacterium]
MMKFRFLFVAVWALLFAGCSVFGVHFKIHNPKRAGKFPEKTPALALFGESTPVRNSYDVKHYDLSVNFGENPLKEKSISGTVIISAVTVTPTDSFQLDLKEHMQLISAEMRMSEKEEWGTVRFSWKYNTVFVRADRVIDAGKKVQIRLNYTGTPVDAKRPPWRGGFVRKTDDQKRPWMGVACQSEGAGVWWPCKDAMNDEPDSMNIRLNVPKGLTAVANGRFIDTVSAGNALTTWNWKLSCPINVYNVTFYIGKFRLLHDTYQSTVTGKTLDLNHYVLDYNYTKAQTHFVQLKEQLKFYEMRFGAYPWYEDGFKLVESPYAGMEHQSAIAYGNGYKNHHKYAFDYIILHETAHEWWGNSVTAADLADGWLHEGFATYSEALFVEHKYGRENYENYLLNQQLFIINRRPVVGPKGIRYFNYKDSDIYVKGAWILHTLRSSINNDSLFFDIIKTFATRYYRSQISSQQFIDLVNEKTGQDYSPFFAQYLNNRFVPEIEFFQDSENIYYRWKKTNPDFNLSIRAKGLISGTAFTPQSTQINRSSIDYRSFEIRWYYYLVKPVENKKLKGLYEKQENNQR